MDLQKEDMPATIQAFDLQNDKEVFIAEQVVHNQDEVKTFTNRYSGKLIKAIKAPVVPITNTKSYGNTIYPLYSKKRSSTGIVMFIIVLVIVALVIYGFSTGWIQQKLNLNI